MVGDGARGPEVQVSAPDPFDPCDGCGHARRCHDSRGCGKWIEAYARMVYNPLEVDWLGGWSVEPVPAHTCPCDGFKEATS